jgi:pilus assembly protein CpaD
MHIVCTGGDHRPASTALLRAAIAFGFALLVCGCNTDQQITGAPAVPTDYRLRHPISIAEKDHTLQLFIGVNRGLLTPMQRAQLLAFGQSWKSEATGGVIIDVPVGSANERSAAAALGEIESILAATGVPRPNMAVRKYLASAANFATVRVSYPRVAAQAGPCGLWPENVGPSLNRDYVENQPPWDFGCATQRNLAAMVDNPADLVQPRAETPVDETRRTTVIGNYEQGKDTVTQYSNPNAGKIATSVGQ